MNRFTGVAAALVLGLALATSAVVPANAVTLNFPDRSCVSGKHVKTTTSGRYTIEHWLNGGAGNEGWTFYNGSATTTNNRTWWMQISYSGHANGIYLNSASTSCA